MKQLIDKYFREYEKVYKKDIKTLSLEDRYPFADLILKHEFSLDNNCTLKEIYKKVVLLNSLYSTNIYATFDVAINISQIKNFKDRVLKGDIELVDEIRKNTIGGVTKDFYSFATKYCHHHNPDSYPIYDSIVKDMLLIYLKKVQPNKRYYRNRMKEYGYFKSAIDQLADCWNLSEEYRYRKLDKFLWKKGKEM